METFLSDKQMEGTIAKEIMDKLDQSNNFINEISLEALTNILNEYSGQIVGRLLPKDKREEFLVIFNDNSVIHVVSYKDRVDFYIGLFTPDKNTIN